MQSALPEALCIDPARVTEFWPHVKDRLRAAIERTNLSDFGWLEKEVLDGKQLVWIAWGGEHIEAVATTQLIRPVCILTACSGHRRERWLHLRRAIENYAEQEGCSTLRVVGRKGWERVLDDYRVEYVILEKTLGRID